jgi:hypothetical protein
MRIDYATERLLPGEVAPMFERYGSGTCIGGRETFRSIALTLFRHRLIVDFIRPAR